MNYAVFRISQTKARMIQSVLLSLSGSLHMQFLQHLTPPIYLASSYWSLRTHHFCGLFLGCPVPRAADGHCYGHTNQTEIHVVSTETTLMSEIRSQDEIWCFLTDGCLAFICYSSVEMTEKAFLIEIVV